MRAMIPSLLAVLLLAALPLPLPAAAAEIAAQRATALNAVPPPAAAKHPKLASALVEAVTAHARIGKAWQDSVSKPELLVAGDRILVEIRLTADDSRRLLRSFAKKGVRVRHHNVPRLIEAWVPVDQLRAFAADPSVAFIEPAQQVIPLAGTVDTEEVAAGGANLWHAAGIIGAGVVLGNIDGGYTNFAAVQALGDWPPAAQLTTVDVNGGGFGMGSTHGTSTVEINHDMAPGAHVIAYETSTRGDWYAALVSTPADGVRVVSVSLGMPLDGVGDGSECPPNFPAPCGSIAEASGIARSQGVLVVNAAGNERDKHWGGLYNDSLGVPGTHDWGGGNVLQSSVCLPAGFAIRSTLHWDDWTNVNHDYDLLLVRRVAGPAWQAVAASQNPQNGGAGQRPEEFIAFNAAGASPGCPPNTSNYGYVVQRINAPTDLNLQLFARLRLFAPVPARSLGFPGDSPNVFTVAAVDVNTLAQEPYSSEGPVLGPGGSLAASAIAKPDAASVANVSTVTDGVGGFNGTSSATPHVAGWAALLLQFNPWLTVPQLEAQLQWIAAANDLGAPGFDFQHGWGAVRLAVGPGAFDTDWDGILDDGDASGLAGDNPCVGGAVANCDDNCVVIPNADQADADGDGIGDLCDN